MSPSPLQTAYPWTTTPLITSAPMGGFALHALACAVSQAGGLGFIGSTNSMPQLSEELLKAQELLSKTPVPRSSSLSAGAKDLLPVGVGFIVFAANLDEAAKLVKKYRPAAVWFFAAKDMRDYATWTQRMRQVSPETKVWIQAGSVASAVLLAETCSPDVLVMQGLDAGGHGYEKGAGIVSLVPEAVDTLAEKGFGNIHVVASGGIADGRGATAALALGAEGVVVGTRFLGSEEVFLPAEGFKNAVLKAKDGGQSTVRDKVYDQLRGPNIWPTEYDGRALVNESYNDLKSGVGLEEIQRLHQEASSGADKGFGDAGKGGRAAVWAGTGVGLVKEVKGARDIVVEIREGAKRAMENARARL